MPVGESVLLCLCIAARLCQHPRGPVAFWRDCGDRILCTGGRAPDTLEVPTQHRVIEGPDIGYDRRLHPGVTIDTNHLPTLSAEHLSNTGSTAKYL